MCIRLTGTLWIGVETNRWTTVDRDPVSQPQLAVKFNCCGTAADPADLGEIKARKKHTIEKDLGFLRIGSLNVRVKKTTEAFSNFLGVGNGNGPTPMVYGHGERLEATRPHQQTHRHPHQRRHHHANGTTRGLHLNQRASGTIPYGTNNNTIVGSRSSVPISRNTYDAVHKSWGSADNITQHLENLMPPPKSAEYRQYKSTKRSSFASNATDSPRDSICSSNSSFNLNTGYSSMPTTPNQIRTPKTMGLSSIPVDSDSDSACGFDSNWSVHD
ncbi:uncharacterized protein LOC108600466 isoform X8 [Drosophila busckii]|nr:uncharacterized protein LOC108600466 isoform X8 [Drosophila busckii]